MFIRRNIRLLFTNIQRHKSSKIYKKVHKNNIIKTDLKKLNINNEIKNKLEHYDNKLDQHDKNLDNRINDVIALINFYMIANSITLTFLCI